MSHAMSAVMNDYAYWTRFKNFFGEENKDLMHELMKHLKVDESDEALIYLIDTTTPKRLQAQINDFKTENNDWNQRKNDFSIMLEQLRLRRRIEKLGRFQQRNPFILHL